MYYLAVFKVEALHSVGEITRGRVAVASIEFGDQYALAAELKYVLSVQTLLRPWHELRSGSILYGGSYIHLFRHVTVDEVLLHHAVFHYRALLCSNTFRVEEL